MKYADINKRFTETVAEYIGKGYTINSASMGGSQGEKAKVDLTDGSEIIRVMIASFSDWSNNLEGVEIVVGRCTDADVVPHNGSGRSTIWNNRLEVLSQERFYKVGEDRRHGTFYGTADEAKAANELRFNRYRARSTGCNTVDITERAMEIAKRIIQREFGVKRIRNTDIRVTKRDGSYTIGYKGKAYRLH